MVGTDSADRAQSGAGDPVLRSAARIPGELHHGLGDLLRRDDRLQDLDERLQLDALARSVRPDRLRAEAGGRGQLRKQRDEPDVQPGTLRLVGRVPAEIPG
jgi:hypothetical protein